MTTRTLLDLPDAARILGVTVRRVTAMVRDGSLPTIILPGEIVRIDERELWTWIDAHRAPTTQSPSVDEGAHV